MPSLSETVSDIQTAIKHKDYTEALDRLGTVFRDHPQCADAYFLAEHIRLRRGSIAPLGPEVPERYAALCRSLPADTVVAAKQKFLGVTISPGSSIEGPVWFEGFNNINRGHLQGPAVSVGLLSYAGHHSFVGTGTTLGRYVSIGMNAVVGPGDHNPDWLTTHNIAGTGIEPRDYEAYHRFAAQTLRVGHDVWIGANTFVRTNLTIGHGAVIGGGAAVVKDVPPFAVVAGVPARVIRMRFPERVVERLLESEWWTLPLDHVTTLPFARIEACLDRIAAIRADLPADSLI